MSLSEPEHEDDGPDLTAAEYVLGVLDAGESAMVRRRLATEAGFAAEVAAWEARLMPLVEEVRPVEPPVSVWESIAGQMGPAPRSRRRGPALWDSLAFWRGLSLGTGVVAVGALAALALSVRPAPAPATGLAAARLTGRGGAVAYTVVLDAERRQLVVTPTGGARPQNRSPELWLLPKGGKAVSPRSMGVLASSARALPAPDGLGAGSALVVTMEPLGGSPSGAPSGPVVAQGRLDGL